MSKSLGNYVGVTEPAAEIFGKLMSVPDDAMPLYWELLLGETLDDSRHPNEAKRDFATPHLRPVRRGRGAARPLRSASTRSTGTARFPRTSPSTGSPTGATSTCPVLIREAFGVSGSEARRLIAQGAVKIDGEPIDPERLDMPSTALSGSVLQVGKRRFARITTD